MIHRNAYMTDELQQIYDQTVEFVSREVVPHGNSWEDAGSVPRDVLLKMGSLGMLGLRVPEEHGGLGLGPLASATFSEALGSSTFAGFEVTVLVHTDMSGPHLVNSGTDEQLAEWMPERHLPWLDSSPFSGELHLSQIGCRRKPFCLVCRR